MRTMDIHLHISFLKDCNKALFFHEGIYTRKHIWTFELIILTYSIVFLALIFWPYLGQIGRDQEGPGGRPSATRRARFSGRRCARPRGRYRLEYRARKNHLFLRRSPPAYNTTVAANNKQIFNYFCEKNNICKTPKFFNLLLSQIKMIYILSHKFCRMYCM
jgi:hypothetical protein